ncbi:MAG: LacI family DNA-binding transcriptional regulator [Propioniciclava sp.]
MDSVQCCFGQLRPGRSGWVQYYRLMPVTRNDVARAAGVSSAVVSYVVNGGPRPVSAATRQRVLDAIDQLGYRRDSVARSMRTGTTDSIGLILPDIGLSYFAVMTQRVTDIARQRGLSVMVATSNGRADLERDHLLEMAGRRVDGVILMSVHPQDELGTAEALGIPVLLVDRPSVAVNGMVTITEHLIDHGLSQVARMAPPPGYAISPRREVGWRRALEQRGLDPSTARIAQSDISEPAGYHAGRTLLDGDDPPEGIVVDSGPQAMGLLRAAADLGVRVPEDLAVIAMEAGVVADYTVPRLSSMDSPIEEIAAEALAAIATAPRRNGLLTLSGTAFSLHLRESCGHLESSPALGPMPTAQPYPESGGGT